MWSKPTHEGSVIREKILQSEKRSENAISIFKETSKEIIIRSLKQYTSSSSS